MDFDQDLSGWTVGVPIGQDPIGTWSVQWSSDYGGSAEIYVDGAPGATDIAQNTLCAIMPGDQLTVNVYHTNMDHFSDWDVLLDGSQILGGSGSGDGAEGFQSLTWTADQAYDAGTQIMLHAAAWPGSSTTWFESIAYTPAPEPSTITLLGVGAISLLGCAWRRWKRAA
ncbi:MAG: PEP-CTERM sorting domain-containing protein [Thermoguttaceae bacterium]|jgi:hypothetical protein